MDRTSANEVLLVRAFETTGFAGWGEADRAWASREALKQVGADAPTETFIAARAHAALQRLATLEPALRRWRAVPAWRGEWWLLAFAAGLLAGLLVDQVGSAQRINLLAPPVWAVIVWNLAVYAALLGRRLFAPASPGWLRRALSAGQRRWSSRQRAPGDAGNDAVWRAFAASAAQRSAPLAAARLAMLLHVASAALALGLIGGLYVRGLVLDYRVGWQSTFVDAATAQWLLATLLAPASLLTGIAVPDVDGIRALRVEPGAAAPSASAAPWIHLYAVQLLWLVVLPRLALAAWAARRAHTLAGHFALPPDDPYFQRLRVEQHGGALQIAVWPYALHADAAAQRGVRTVLAEAFGAAAQVTIEPTVEFGAEDDWRGSASPGTPGAPGTLAVALFDLAATPEAENHGRFLQRLAADRGAAPGMLVDEAAFKRRFDQKRVQSRRQGWSELGRQFGVRAVFVDLHNPGQSPVEPQLGAAAVDGAAAQRA